MQRNRQQGFDNTVSIAQWLVHELTDWESEAILDTLAAAYAELGDFDNAVKWARKAVELATEEHRQGEEMRLKLYKEGKPYREIDVRRV